jgi:hypothetical protein
MNKQQFNLSKSAKRMLALTSDQAKANTYKSIFIESEKAEIVAKQQKIKMKDSTDERN